MSGLQLATVVRPQGNSAALRSGELAVPGVTLAYEDVPVLIHAFRRMVRELSYDVCEMAFTTYLCARAHGTRFTALPVFLARGFHHGAILRNTGAPIHSGKDLEGRTVGVDRGYTVTTGVWARSILRLEHDLDYHRVIWAPSGDEHVAGYQPPANVVPLAAGQDLGALLAAGTLPAAVGALSVDSPEVAPLIAEPLEAAHRALRERGFYPINHVLVVKDEVLAAHGDLAAELFAVFAEAKRRYVTGLADRAPAGLSGPDLTYRQVLDLTGSDPLPYGIGPNRAMIELLVSEAVAQGILPSEPEIGTLFAEGTHSLTG